MTDLSKLRIFVCTSPIKMNFSFDGLMGLAQATFDQDPFSGHLFLFFSTLAMSGLDGFVFLADGQEIDLCNTGFNLTLGNPLAGDFNADGTVNAADYVVWRKTDGTPEGYNLWRSHFGQNAGSGSGVGTNTAVPEPATLMLFIIGMIMTSAARRHRCSSI